MKNGGSLYISGGDCIGLLKRFFDAEIIGRTEEKVIYISPKPYTKAVTSFGWFNENYPLHFDGKSPIIDGIKEENVIATITLPYTKQDISKFASIHSDPPGIRTNYPAMAFTKYGKGKVLWSALPIENIETSYHYGDIFVSLLENYFDIKKTVTSTAPEDVEIIAFKNDNNMTISAVQYCVGSTARYVEPFTVSVRTNKKPQKLLQLCDETECDFVYENGFVKYTVDNLNIFEMKKIIF